MDSFDELLKIMKKLRGDNGCPWDKVQTHESLKPYLVEEAYEVQEAIDNDDPEELKDELGDLLYQVIFHAQLASEQGRFDMNDVLKASIDKMTRRHPHVFGDENLHTPQEVLSRWEESKKKEKNGKKSVLDGMPSALPSLLLAFQLQKKAARVGFDWSEKEPALAKIKEELSELEDAIAAENKKHMEEELGDLLFSIVNIARFLKLDPDAAMRKANNKFVARFKKMEHEINSAFESGFEGLTLEDMDKVWTEVKSHED